MNRFKYILTTGISAFFLFMLQSGLLAQGTPVNAAATQVVKKSSIYQNPVFYALVFVAIVLMVFIMQLAKVLSAVARNYKRGDGSAWDKLKSVVLIIGFSIFGSVNASAQAAAEVATKEDSIVLKFLHDGFGSTPINALVFIIILELLVILYYVRMIRLFLVKPVEPEPYVEPVRKASVFWDRFNSSVSIEKEADVMTDHDYDGIRELDNALPPWWKYGFYLTIVFAVFYLVYFHVVDKGPSSLKEYTMELEEAEIQLAAFKAKSAGLVDESNVKLLTDATSLAEGKAHFTQFCVVCHGKAGEGLVGPNLTDDYWIHGGDIKSIFKTVKYGVQGKGMKSWQQELSPQMIAQVASYIQTLHGTNPPNPKAPEGDLYKPASDSTGVKADTISAPVIISENKQ